MDAKSTVQVLSVGIDLISNLTSSKFVELKLEFVIAVKLSHKITSPMFKPWSAAKVIVTVADPLVVENALVKVDVALIGWMS